MLIPSEGVFKEFTEVLVLSGRGFKRRILRTLFSKYQYESVRVRV